MDWKNQMNYLCDDYRTFIRNAKREQSVPPKKYGMMIVAKKKNSRKTSR